MQTKGWAIREACKDTTNRTACLFVLHLFCAERERTGGGEAEYGGADEEDRDPAAGRHLHADRQKW